MRGQPLRTGSRVHRRCYKIAGLRALSTLSRNR